MPKFKANKIPAISIVTIGLLLSLLIFNFVSTRQTKDLKARFISESENLIHIFEQAVFRKIYLVQSLRAFYDSSMFVQRNEFKRFTESFLIHQLGLQIVGWAPAVPVEKKEAFEEEVRKEGYRHFEILDDRDPEKLEDEEEQFFFPIYFIEPYEGNELVMGVNLGQDPIFFEALIESKNTDQVTVTKPMKDHEGFGVMSFLPIYEKKSVVGGTEVDRTKLKGFVFGALHIARIFDAVVKDLRPDGIDIYVVDETPGADLKVLYDRNAINRGGIVIDIADIDVERTPFFYKRTVKVRGRQWAVYCLPNDYYLTFMKPWLNWLIAGIFFSICILLALFVANIVEQSEIIKKTVKERTRELRKSQIDLKKEVRQHEEAKVALDDAMERLQTSHDTLQESTDKLSEANVQLKQMDDLKNDFISAASHELRTPLTAIKGYVSLIIQGRVGMLNDKQKEFLGFVKESTDRLHRLVNNLLDLSRIESGKTHSEKESIELDALIEKEIMIFKVQADEKDIQIQYEAQPDMPKLIGAPDQIKEAIGNLISNALKYTNHNGRVSIAARHDGAGWQVEVQDNGIGIETDDLEKIFEPFYAVQKVEDQDHESTGLGLCLVKKIMDHYHGQVLVDSKIGNGSTFKLIFPNSKS